MTTESSLAFEPVKIGPTWQKNDDGSWDLPELTLGWHVLAWVATWLQNNETQKPWTYTPEQARFLLWWYAIDYDGRFIYRNGVLQRLKGWGKDPLAATMALVELCGPCRFSGEFAVPNNPEGVPEGQPIGVRHPSPVIQIAAVSEKQTANTMELIPGLLPKATMKEFVLEVGKTYVYCKDIGFGKIDAVTSNYRSLEGARPTFAIANETHHWLDNNQGHDMWRVFKRNSAKIKGGSSRILAITNAYQPGENSVAEQTRDAWEAVQAGDAVDIGTLYDSLEAPPEAPLTAEAAPKVLEAIRGDSTWLDISSLVAEILDTENAPSMSRRWWYNQIVANEDSWVAPYEWDALESKELELQDRDYLALFFDGSKSDDNTALVACRIDDGAVFKLGLWIPSKDRPVDRDAVDAIVSQTHAKYRVVGFFADPGSGEDETGERYWDRYIDDWSNRFGDKYAVHPVQSGMKKHSVMWPMTGNMRQEEFTHAVERTYADIIAGNFRHDGDRKLRQHVTNAKRRPNDWGVSIGKRHRMAREKIDLAICMVGARMVRRLVLGSKDWGKKPTGKGRVIVLR